jgi:hypothetical protein
MEGHWEGCPLENVVEEDAFGFESHDKLIHPALWSRHCV